jgi:hypothetical protein
MMALERSNLTAVLDAIPRLLLPSLAACTEDDLRSILAHVDEGQRRHFFSSFAIHNVRARSYRLLVHSLASASPQQQEYAGHFLGAAVGGAIYDSLSAGAQSSFAASSKLLRPLVEELGVGPVRLGLVELAGEAGEKWPIAGALLLCDEHFKLPGWPVVGITGDEFVRGLGSDRERIEPAVAPVSRIETKRSPSWFQADDQFVAGMTASDPILDPRPAEDADILLNRLIGALDGSVDEARVAADRVAAALRAGTAPAPTDLAKVVSYGRRFVVASDAASLARRAAGLSDAGPLKSLDSLRTSAQEFVEYQIRLALEMRLRRIGQSLDGPAGLADSIAEIRASADRLAPNPESDPALRDGLLALADLIELATEDGAWEAIDDAEGQARTGLPETWGRVIVAAVRGRLSFEGVTPVHVLKEAVASVAPPRADPVPRDRPPVVADDEAKELSRRLREEPVAPAPVDDSDTEQTVDITEPTRLHRPRPGTWRQQQNTEPWVTNRTP